MGQRNAPTILKHTTKQHTTMETLHFYEYRLLDSYPRIAYFKPACSLSAELANSIINKEFIESNDLDQLRKLGYNIQTTRKR